MICLLKSQKIAIKIAYRWVCLIKFELEWLDIQCWWRLSNGKSNSVQHHLTYILLLRLSSYFYFINEMFRSVVGYYLYTSLYSSLFSFTISSISQAYTYYFFFSFLFFNFISFHSIPQQIIVTSQYMCDNLDQRYRQCEHTQDAISEWERCEN